MQDDFLQRLDRARGIAEVPFVINSGYRCRSRNKAVGGSKGSSHMIGWAADIKATDDKSRGHILHGLYMAGFTRIGIRKDFIHVDADPAKNEKRTWLY
ncbi:MAG: peptidase M15 [Pseudodesulfovibrio sp.]|nr:peptidase M15 [Pseudodesulfovibrio sp.]